MTRILIADDHDLVLEGLKKALADVASEIVCARTYNEAVAQLDGPAFDFCIIDYGLKPGTGDRLLRIVREKMPNAKAICISGDFTPATLAQLGKVGFDGFYSKSDPMDEVIAAVESLETDGVFYSSSVQLMMREVTDFPKLSGRQAELLAHIVAGRSNKDASHLMGVEPATVSFHMKHLKLKLKVANGRELIAKAKELGLPAD